MGQKLSRIGLPMLPADYLHCFGIVSEHTAEPDCPRRHMCARFVSLPDLPPNPPRVRFGLCSDGNDYFIGRVDEVEKQP